MPDLPSLAVRTAGFSWTTVGVFAVNALGVSSFGVWLAQRPNMRKLSLNRIDRLEQRMDREQARHEIVEKLLRHRVRNSEACMDLFLDHIEMAEGDADKIQRAVQVARKMRERHREEELREREVAITALATILGRPPSNEDLAL